MHSCKFKGKILPRKDVFWQFILPEVCTLVSQIKSWFFSSVSSHHWRNILHLHQPHLLCSPWLFVQSLFVQTCNINMSGFFNMQPFSPCGYGLGCLQPKTYLLASDIPQRNTLLTFSKRAAAFFFEMLVMNIFPSSKNCVFNIRQFSSCYFLCSSARSWRLSVLCPSLENVLW